jgi:hypothetical protein
MTIVIDDSRIINKLEASLTDDTRVIIYNCHMFIVQANGFRPPWLHCLTHHVVPSQYFSALCVTSATTCVQPYLHYGENCPKLAGFKKANIFVV